ncbi:mitochondrial fission regulator 2 isoform X2 [Octopus bimaculoides]|uniref:WH2 domain-containing protein n=2 Tax=Octopus bimaculoides TaxID=37653 RepID=A0A0L8GHF5_OCTBM|nr:mitochondrial fission regulator 2 isoform X2 [Octopus bimaculoides]XP_014781006.1 mitochondrial fission regulator 2 isoform X2 [Octopus bimaculoides]|eukprot:XP_014781005.1 PREDICTED: mitochondrial fission regulator 2-like isoform X2 [Octopus bimaculoides]
MFLAFGSFVFSWLYEVASQQNTFTSLVKRVFSSLSTSKKVKALKDHFHPKTVYRVLQENYGSDSDSGLSESSEIAWIEEDLGNNCIAVRTQMKNRRNLHFNQSVSTSINLAEPLSTSTPHNPFEESVNSLQKINEMQSEIEKLKEQIAMMCNTAAFKSEGTSSNHSTVSPTSQTHLPRTLVPPPPPPPIPPVLRAAPPPPPPPPPPSALKTSDSSSKPNKEFMSLGDMLKQRMASEGGLIGGLKSTSTTGADKPPSMADVLKNLNSVKLKPVERSPGGTPLKRSPLPCTTTDHQSIIANALKIKFSKINQHSPDHSQKRRSLNSPHWSSPSPPRVFGRHLLKKTGKPLN